MCSESAILVKQLRVCRHVTVSYKYLLRPSQHEREYTGRQPAVCLWQRAKAMWFDIITALVNQEMRTTWECEWFNKITRDSGVRVHKACGSLWPGAASLSLLQSPTSSEDPHEINQSVERCCCQTSTCCLSVAETINVHLIDLVHHFQLTICPSASLYRMNPCTIWLTLHLTSSIKGPLFIKCHCAFLWGRAWDIQQLSQTCSVISSVLQAAIPTQTFIHCWHCTIPSHSSCCLMVRSVKTIGLLLIGGVFCANLFRL